MKTERQLSGIYFRVENEGKFENRVFEDLTTEQQNKIMEGRSEEWLKSLAQQLAGTINRISEQFDISAD